MPHTNVSEAEHTKAGNVKRRTESQKLEETLLRKSTARISACLIGNSPAEIHSENIPGLKLSCSRISRKGHRQMGAPNEPNWVRLCESLYPTQNGPGNHLSLCRQMKEEGGSPD